MLIQHNIKSRPIHISQNVEQLSLGRLDYEKENHNYFLANIEVTNI